MNISKGIDITSPSSGGKIHVQVGDSGKQVVYDSLAMGGLHEGCYIWNGTELNEEDDWYRAVHSRTDQQFEDLCRSALQQKMREMNCMILHNGEIPSALWNMID